ncbi:hypothetical protein RHMOL_Rhmol01G0053700 [Rhododendron molle]|uniref:Uncharacterized protein n=1 Tax=Rhododendron molle TaxID=49168 RepID=A0ACC0PY76_RHOML|nr:hypothetical protein RHMOL_Rhmol01G0053700 [Rhododendron molle]
MTVPTGYLFRPTDQELLLKYLDKKITDEALPCGVVIEHEIYGAGNKASVFKMRASVGTAHACFGIARVCYIRVF